MIDRPTFAEHPVRLAALAAGEVRFDLGEPCPHGHISERYTRGGTCVECQRVSARDRYRASHPPRPPRPPKYQRVKSAAEQLRDREQHLKETPNKITLGSLLADYEKTAISHDHSKHCDRVLRALDGLKKPAEPKQRSRHRALAANERIRWS